jgi:hypothetical protein
MRHRKLLSVILAVWLYSCPAAIAGDLEYALVSPEVLMQRLRDAPAKNVDRADKLQQMFKDVGCQPTEEQVKRLREPNVLCTLPGASASIVIVSGHLDHVDRGAGIVDDWSGASMLPSLYQSLSRHPRSHTFLFIGFAGEEEGMVGSDFYLKHLLPEERKQIAAMVNLECLGTTPTKVWTSHSDPTLVRMLVAMAQSVKLPLSGINVERVGTDDAQEFTRYRIPHITIHSITQETLPLLHNEKDNITAVKPDLYYDSYRLIAGYLALLDGYVPTDGSPPDGVLK